MNGDQIMIRSRVSYVCTLEKYIHLLHTKVKHSNINTCHHLGELNGEATLEESFPKSCSDLLLFPPQI